VIDIAPDTTYAYKLTIKPIGPVLTTSPVDLSTQFPGVTSFVFRIGARNSEDMPGPSKNPAYTGNISNPDVNPNGGSYIYTADSSFSGS